MSNLIITGLESNYIFPPILLYVYVREKSFLSTRLTFLQIDVVVGLRYTFGNFQQTAWWQRQGTMTCSIYTLRGASWLRCRT